MKKQIIAFTIILLTLVSMFSGCLEEEKVSQNKKPVIDIIYPYSSSTVSKIITISGEAIDPNGDDTIKLIEIMINGTWVLASGTTKWSYDWNVYDLEDGRYTISARAWDGNLYSEIDKITVNVNNPDVIDTDEHKYAVFTFVGNFPEENESKLGNGGLYLAEEIASYLVEEKNYPTSNIYILFDDGWIRKDEGLGERLETLQKRYHPYDFFYGAATKSNFESVINNVVESANSFEDSELFLWVSSHGCGDDENLITGGKLFERSSIFLWDDILTDKDLGQLLQNLKSKKTCVIVDACYSGGFADKTIFNLPELFLFNSGIPGNGRVVITGASKFRVGYASVTEGPLFSYLWFYGLSSLEADGYKSGLFNKGKPSRLNLFRDGEVSVEEAFYYAKYVIRTSEDLKDYSNMEPQISDRYPKGLILNSKGLILG